MVACSIFELLSIQHCYVKVEGKINKNIFILLFFRIHLDDVYLSNYFENHFVSSMSLQIVLEFKFTLNFLF